MNHTKDHQGHMWLIGGGVIVALLLGLGIGWVIAVALLVCAATLALVFWIGRTAGRSPRGQQDVYQR